MNVETEEDPPKQCDILRDDTVIGAEKVTKKTNKNITTEIV